MKSRITFYLLLTFAFIISFPSVSQELDNEPLDVITLVATEDNLPFSLSFPMVILVGFTLSFGSFGLKLIIFLFALFYCPLKKV